MRPPWWRHYKINMHFHFGERLIIIVNSGGLISPRREWDERVQVYGNHARWVGVNRIEVERISEVWGRRTELSIKIVKLPLKLRNRSYDLWPFVARYWETVVHSVKKFNQIPQNPLPHWVNSTQCVSVRLLEGIGTSSTGMGYGSSCSS